MDFTYFLDVSWDMMETNILAFSDLPRGISSIEAPANDGWILWDRWDARGGEYHGNDTSKMCKLVSFMMMLNMVLTF